MLYNARRRAKRLGVECSIRAEDIQIPPRCPLLDIPLVKGTRVSKQSAPTLDRIDPKRGYVPGNVWVISHRANTIKNDATCEELELIAENLRAKCRS